jgi:exopolysaccharide biosynthesis WecB/TagA/CpsF family protein
VWVEDLIMPELLRELDEGVVFTLNLDHLYHLQRDRAFYEAYRQADFITCDSNYVFWALGRIGRKIRGKVCGSDLVPAFCWHHRDNPDVKVFLLGAAPGIAQTARERLNARVGREMVVGAHSPSMRFVDDESEISSVIETVKSSGANVLIVGLGAPKQEIWIAKHRRSMPNVKILMGVGATLDYEAGARKRAPRWMSKGGLEWAYRVATEPRRYGLRYLRDMEFFSLVAKDGLGRYRSPL